MSNDEERQRGGFPDKQKHLMMRAAALCTDLRTLAWTLFELACTNKRTWPTSMGNEQRSQLTNLTESVRNESGRFACLFQTFEWAVISAKSICILEPRAIVNIHSILPQTVSMLTELWKLISKMSDEVAIFPNYLRDRSLKREVKRRQVNIAERLHSRLILAATQDAHECTLTTFTVLGDTLERIKGLLRCLIKVHIHAIYRCFA